MNTWSHAVIGQCPGTIRLKRMLASESTKGSARAMKPTASRRARWLRTSAVGLPDRDGIVRLLEFEHEEFGHLSPRYHADRGGAEVKGPALRCGAGPDPIRARGPKCRLRLRLTVALSPALPRRYIRRRRAMWLSP